jgi:putative transcriptional regulator
MSVKNLLKGKLLVSEPSSLNDRSFNRSVIYLTEDNTDGSVGFIINKETEFVLSDLISNINCRFKIYSGGPVEQENLYFIHTVPELIPNSIEISNGIFWGGDFNVLTALLNNNKIKESEIRFFLGYSGWSKNQLKTELTESNWIVVENKYPDLLHIDSDEIWKNQILKLGGKYQIWANAPKNPSLN